MAFPLIMSKPGILKGAGFSQLSGGCSWNCFMSQNKAMPWECATNKQVLLQGKAKLITSIYEPVNAYIDYLKLLFDPEVNSSEKLKSFFFGKSQNLTFYLTTEGTTRPS